MSLCVLCKQLLEPKALPADGALVLPDSHVDVFDVSDQTALERKLPAANFAFVVLFLCVCDLVAPQARLGRGLKAAHVALVRSVARVHAFVNLEVVLLLEGFLAHLTDVFWLRGPRRRVLVTVVSVPAAPVLETDATDGTVQNVHFAM